MPKVGGVTSQKYEEARGELKQTVDTMNRSYISGFIATLNKINELDEYKTGQETPFIEAIQAYDIFVNCYLKEVLTELKIYPRKEFFSKKYFTCAVLGNSDHAGPHEKGKWFQLTEDSFDKVIVEATSLLRIYTESSTINEKLREAERVIASILSKTEALVIIQGVIKLTTILGDAQLLHESKLDFDMYLRPGVNAFVDFLLLITAGCYQINTAMIHRDLLAQGTVRQRQKMQDMIDCCANYCDQLKDKSNFNESSGLLEAARISSQLYLFQILVQSLRKIHLDCESTASEKISMMTLQITTTLNRPQVREQVKDDKMFATLDCSVNRLIGQSITSDGRRPSKCPYSFYINKSTEPPTAESYRSYNGLIFK